MSRRIQGYATISHPEDKLIEMDTYTCPHCNCIVHIHNQDGSKKKPEDQGGWCAKCEAPTCVSPGCNNGCVPFMKQVEESEKRQFDRRRFLEAIGV